MDFGKVDDRNKKKNANQSQQTLNLDLAVAIWGLGLLTFGWQLSVLGFPILDFGCFLF